MAETTHGWEQTDLLGLALPSAPAVTVSVEVVEASVLEPEETAPDQPSTQRQPHIVDALAQSACNWLSNMLSR